MNQPTADQTKAADMVVEAALLMQKCIRDAERLGLYVSVSVWRLGGPDGRSNVDAAVTLVEEVELARTPVGKK